MFFKIQITQNHGLPLVQFSSVQLSRSVMSNSLQPHESQHARPPCPSPTPGVHSNSSPSSQCCHPAISSSIVPFSSCPQSLPSIRVFSNESTLHMKWPKYWSFSFSIIPSEEHAKLFSFRMDWLDLLAAYVIIQFSQLHQHLKRSQPQEERKQNTAFKLDQKSNSKI